MSLAIKKTIEILKVSSITYCLVDIFEFELAKNQKPNRKQVGRGALEDALTRPIRELGLVLLRHELGFRSRLVGLSACFYGVRPHIQHSSWAIFG